MSYGYFRTFNDKFPHVEKRLRETLSDNGFGVITEIDVKKTMRDKLDIDFKPYKILGACNPHFAFQALKTEPEIGLLLPCNIIIEDNEDGTIRVGAIDAEAMLGIVGKKVMVEFATEVNRLLKKSIDKI